MIDRSSLRKPVHVRALACMLAILCAAIPLVCARALDPVSPGAATVYNGAAPVYSTPADEYAPIAVLADQTEVEVLDGGGEEWAHIAYYHPETYRRESGWMQAQSLINLRTHLKPGPYYINLHEGADVLRTASANGVLIGRIQRDARLDVVASTSDWVEIVFPQANGQLGTGWIKRPYVVPYTPSAIVSTPGTITSADNNNYITDEIYTSPVQVIAAPSDTQPAASTTTFDSIYPPGMTTVTLNAQNPEHAVKLRRKPDAYATSLGLYYSGVVAEYLSYDQSGWVQVRIGTAVGYWPVEDVWLNAPPGAVPSAIPTGRVVELKSGSSLHMREYPNVDSYSLQRFVSGTEVEILASADSWFQVRVNDSAIGYMYSQYVGRIVTQYIDQNTVPRNPPFNGAAEEAGRDADQEEPGVSTAAAQDGWTPVPTPDIGGWASPLTSDDSAVFTNPTVVVSDGDDANARALPPYAVIRNRSGGRLNLRERPDASSQSLGQYYNGVCVTINSSYDNEWVNVSIGLTSGYMTLDYLDTVNVPKGAPKVYAAEIPRMRLIRAGSGSISMYAAMNALSDELGSFSPDTQAIVLGVGQAWSHVVVSGRVGYIRNENLGE